MIIASAVFSPGNIGVSVITFIMAYIFGYMLTVGHLMQDGMALPKALKDALFGDSKHYSDGNTCNNS